MSTKKVSKPVQAPTPLPGTVRRAELNKFLGKGEIQWPFPGSPSQGTLQARAEAAGYKVVL